MKLSVVSHFCFIILPILFKMSIKYNDFALLTPYIGLLRLIKSFSFPLMSSVFLFGHGFSLEECISCLIAFFALSLVLPFRDGELRRPTRLVLGLGVGFIFILLLCF